MILSSALKHSSLKFPLIVLFAISIFVQACKKHLDTAAGNHIEQQNDPKAQLLKERLEIGAIIFKEVIKEPSTRKDFCQFIKAKVAKTGFSEELTFEEIFSDRSVNLKGVAPDFLRHFKVKFLDAVRSPEVAEQLVKRGVVLETHAQVQDYFWQNRPSSSTALHSTDDEFLPPELEIFYPYSENFDHLPFQPYAVTYNPLHNMHSHWGSLFDPRVGEYVEIVEVDDEYAFNHPTFIITYDDGLRYSDFLPGDPLTELAGYDVTVYNHDFEPTRIIRNPLPRPMDSVCTTELRVADGRWTTLGQYGIFEGKIEFAVATSIDLSSITFPTGQNNPIVNFSKTAASWAYKPIKRRLVREMANDSTKFVDLGFKGIKWCPQDPDKAVLCYEFDRPQSATKQFLEGVTPFIAGQLVRDSTQRAHLANAITATVMFIVSGASTSKEEGIFTINRNAVYANQFVRTGGATPGLINGRRPYNKNDVAITFAVD